MLAEMMAAKQQEEASKQVAHKELSDAEIEDCGTARVPVASARDTTRELLTSRAKVSAKNQAAMDLCRIEDRLSVESNKDKSKPSVNIFKKNKRKNAK